MATAAAAAPPAVFPLRRVAEAWWPLAASWLFMALELPVMSAVVARLPDPAVHLAAYGGVVFPVALLVESPIIMLLAASTALSRDWGSYRQLRRFMHAAGAALTLLHLLLAFTPLYDLVIVSLLDPPLTVREPARLGLQIMTPWTWSIAFRRFHQGVLIRFGRSRDVGLGTAVRLLANVVVLAAGYSLRDRLPGIAVGAGAVAAGVVAEAVYVGLRVGPVLRERVRPAAAVEPALSAAAFFRFYLPLALTSLLTLLMQPIGAAALSRMPRPLDSLAVWPVIMGLVFMTKAVGIAYNEVVVSLAGEPGAAPALWRFAAYLAAIPALVLTVLAATPLARLWFGGVSGLPPDLADLAARALWLALPLPVLSVLESWYQGLLVHSGRTRGIPESMALYLAAASGLAVAGVAWGGATGLYVALGAIACASGLQVAWLRQRSRPARAALGLGLV